MTAFEKLDNKNELMFITLQMYYWLLSQKQLNKTEKTLRMQRKAKHQLGDLEIFTKYRSTLEYIFKKEQLIWNICFIYFYSHL